MDEARRQVSAYLARQGVESEGLNARGLGLVTVGPEQLAFEFVEAKGALRCAALIYRFRAMPRPAVLEAFRAEQKEGAPTGGGAVEYDGVARAVFLTRHYQSPLTDDQFAADLARLLEACRDWREVRAASVAARAFRNDLR